MLLDWKKIMPISIGLVILFMIIWFANPGVILNYFVKVDLGYVFLAFMLSTVLVFFRVAKWKVLFEDVSLVVLIPVQMLGIAISNLTPGKIGEPAKALLLKMRNGIAVSVSLSTIIWERIADVVMLILLSFFAIQSLSAESRLYAMGFISIGAFVLVILLLLVVMYSRSFGSKMISFFAKFPVLKKMDKGFIRAFYNSKIKKSQLAACFLFTVFAWGLEGFGMYFCFMALGIVVNPLLMSGIIALSVLIGILSMLPGGMGSTDAVMFFLLGMTGIETGAATAGMLLYRLTSFWYGIFLGGLSFLYLSKKIDVNKILK